MHKQNSIISESRLIASAILLMVPLRLFASDIPAAEPTRTAPSPAPSPDKMQPVPPSPDGEMGSPQQGEIMSLPAKSKINAKKGSRKPKTKNQKSSPAGPSTDPLEPNAGEKDKESSSPLNTILHHGLALRALVSSFGGGAGLEYIYQPGTVIDFGVNVGATQASFSRDGENNTTETLSGRMTAAAAFIRLSYYRLIYVGAGLGIASISGSYGFEGSGVSGGALSSDYSAKYILPQVFLGSEWIFGNGLFVGADWVGLSAPIQASLSLASDSDLDVTSDVLTGQKAEDRISDELGAQLKTQLLQLRIGYRF